MAISARSIMAVGVVTLSLTLAGCASSSVGPTGARTAPEDIAPIQNVPVASSNLPAIGQTGTQQNMGTLPMPGQLPASNTLTVGGGAGLGQSQDPMLQGQQLGQQPGQLPAPTTTAANNGSFVTLGAPGALPATPGRDLTGGLTIEKLLGGWTIVSGAEQCKLNLTYTAKAGTSRYRASTPGCTIPGLMVVSSWQLVGTQVQLFDENNDIIASLILSGNRFIGTLAGGQGISMVG
jgi:hypothetical protein